MIGQLIHTINRTERSETFHKESCGDTRGLVIIFRRRGVRHSKPEVRTTFSNKTGLRLVGFRVRCFVFTDGVDGLKAICDVSHFSEVDK